MTSTTLRLIMKVYAVQRKTQSETIKLMKFAKKMLMNQTVCLNINSMGSSEEKMGLLMMDGEMDDRSLEMFSYVS